jgi:hypothetical protein
LAENPRRSFQERGNQRSNRHAINHRLTTSKIDNMPTIYQFNTAEKQRAQKRYAKAKENFTADPSEFIAASLELHRAKGLQTRKPRRR